MTIRPGENWGVPARSPEGLATATGDAELAEMVSRSRQIAVSVVRGDLARTVGVREVIPQSGDEGRRLPIDLIEVVLDDDQLIAVAHVIVRERSWRAWWQGTVIAICNAQFRGRWDLAPRAHPNDGRADLIEMDPTMPLRQRLLAWRRVRTGTHLPHPKLRARRLTEHAWEFERPMTVLVDGQPRRRVRSLRITVVGDGFELFI